MVNTHLTIDIPTNGHSGKAYAGKNAARLAAVQFSKKYPLAIWYTFNQARALGGFVNKGQHGERVIKVTAPPKGQPKTKRNTLRRYTVFNAAQITWPEGYVHPLAMQGEPAEGSDEEDFDDE